MEMDNINVPDDFYDQIGRRMRELSVPDDVPLVVETTVQVTPGQSSEPWPCQVTGMTSQVSTFVGSEPPQVGRDIRQEFLSRGRQTMQQQGTAPSVAVAILEIVSQIDRIDDEYLGSLQANQYYEWDHSRRVYRGRISAPEQWFLPASATILVEAQEQTTVEGYAEKWVTWYRDVDQAKDIISSHASRGVPAEAPWVHALNDMIDEKAERGNSIYAIFRRHHLIGL